ncbi:MAG TPA: hypothetical protein VFZ53_01650 [Polyangiaceae bacterium]
MHRETMAREWLRVVKHYKWQLRVRNREPKRRDRLSDQTAGDPQKRANET